MTGGGTGGCASSVGSRWNRKFWRGGWGRKVGGGARGGMRGLRWPPTSTGIGSGSVGHLADRPWPWVSLAVRLLCPGLLRPSLLQWPRTNPPRGSSQEEGRGTGDRGQLGRRKDCKGRTETKGTETDWDASPITSRAPALRAGWKPGSCCTCRSVTRPGHHRACHAESSFTTKCTLFVKGAGRRARGRAQRT